VRDAAVRDRLAGLGVVAACVEGDALPGPGRAPRSDARPAPG